VRYTSTYPDSRDAEFSVSIQAQEKQEPAFRAPKQRVEDFEELHEYRGRKRKEFEERIRRTRGNMYVSACFAGGREI